MKKVLGMILALCLLLCSAGAALAESGDSALIVGEYILDTGCEALLAVEGEPAALKRLAVAIEDADPLGRLLDIDVLDPAGAPVSRQALGLPERTCLLCGGH